MTAVNISQSQPTRRVRQHVDIVRCQPFAEWMYEKGTSVMAPGGGTAAMWFSEMSELSNSVSRSYTSKVFDKCLWHQGKGFRRMSFCLMTHTARSLFNACQKLSPQNIYFSIFLNIKGLRHPQQHEPFTVIWIKGSVSANIFQTGCRRRRPFQWVMQVSLCFGESELKAIVVYFVVYAQKVSQNSCSPSQKIHVKENSCFQVWGKRKKLKYWFLSWFFSSAQLVVTYTFPSNTKYLLL